MSFFCLYFANKHLILYTFHLIETCCLHEISILKNEIEFNENTAHLFIVFPIMLVSLLPECSISAIYLNYHLVWGKYTPVKLMLVIPLCVLHFTESGQFLFSSSFLSLLTHLSFISFKSHCSLHTYSKQVCEFLTAFNLYPLLHSDQTTPGVLCSALGSPT